MKKGIFNCPDCGKSFMRNQHYLKIVDSDSSMQYAFNKRRVKNMCSYCEYREFEE
jgi:uncharacterized C2H2 Zn-finger protein